MQDLAGKKVLLTGGLGSLGAAQARKLTDHGAKVLIIDRPGAPTADEIVAAAGGETEFFGLDLSDLVNTEATVKELATEKGGFDVLINNAAWIVKRPMETYAIEEYEEALHVNAGAGFALARACVPHMKAQRWGRIINFTSITLTGQWNDYVPYVTSKGAMYGMTKAMAREFGPHNITVNAVSPGAVVSAAENRVYKDRLKEYQQWIIDGQSLKERIMPEDIAELVVFLASERARRISGQNISVDAGW